VREQRERGHLDPSRPPLAVADPQRLVVRAPLLDRDPERHVLERHRRPGVVGGRETRRPVVRPHPAALDELRPEQALGRLVVVDDGPVRVDEEDRGRQARGEVAREDQDQVLLGGALRHGASLNPPAPVRA
jgi:hypothetical protein